MLDQSPQTSTAAAEWQQTLSRGDVVLFRFPLTDDGNPKVRPCLVLDIARLSGLTMIKLAYGTTAATPANRGYEIHVKRRPSIASAGLRRPTRFVGARTVLVRPGNSGFVTIDGSPVIGRLDEPLIERMNDVRTRLAAEATTGLTDARSTARSDVAGPQKTALCWSAPGCAPQQTGKETGHEGPRPVP